MMARAVVRTAFRDLDCGVLREVGEVFEVTPERLERINSTRYGRLAVEVDEDVPEASPETLNDTQPKKRRSRKG